MAYELKELKLTHRNSWVYETNICEDASQCTTKRIGTRPAVLYARLATLGKAGWQVHGVLEAGSSKQESHRLYLLQRQS